MKKFTGIKDLQIIMRHEHVEQNVNMDTVKASQIQNPVHKTRQADLKHKEDLKKIKQTRQEHYKSVSSYLK